MNAINFNEIDWSIAFQLILLPICHRLHHTRIGMLGIRYENLLSESFQKIYTAYLKFMCSFPNLEANRQRVNLAKAQFILKLMLNVCVDCILNNNL